MQLRHLNAAVIEKACSRHQHHTKAQLLASTGVWLYPECCAVLLYVCMLLHRVSRMLFSITGQLLGVVVVHTTC